MEDLPPSPIIDQDGHERFIVEKVLKHKFVRKKTLFFGKMVGLRRAYMGASRIFTG